MTDDLKYWDSISKTFKKDSPDLIWRSHSDAVNTALLDQWLTHGKTGRLLKTDLFDEAESKGMYTLLKLKVKDIIGMDISPMIVKAAQRTHNDLKGIVADIRCLPFHGNRFDTVVSISTLDHFGSEMEIMNGLRELHRVLRIKGQLIITLDNLANPVIFLRSIIPFRLLYRSGIVPYYVGKSSTPRHLILILNQLGFDILSTTAIMHCPRVLAVILSRLLEKTASQGTVRRFLNILRLFERLAYCPTRYLTGYFIAITAMKR